MISAIQIYGYFTFTFPPSVPKDLQHNFWDEKAQVFVQAKCPSYHPTDHSVKALMLKKQSTHNMHNKLPPGLICCNEQKPCKTAFTSLFSDARNDAAGK